jgi:hypothetical protein
LQKRIQRLGGLALNYKRFCYKLVKAGLESTKTDDNAAYLHALTGDDSPSLSLWSLSDIDLAKHHRGKAGQHTKSITTRGSDVAAASRSEVIVATLPSYSTDGGHWIVPPGWLDEEWHKADDEVPCFNIHDIVFN